MRREIGQPNWVEFAKEHAAAVAEMRQVLADRGTVSNRDFAMGSRTRVDDYRGRKDSALALHYLWRIGDAMISRRDRFERVYALTDAVAPPELIREHRPGRGRRLPADEGGRLRGPDAGAHRRQLPATRRPRGRAGRLAEAQARGRRAGRGDRRGLAGAAGRTGRRRASPRGAAGRPRAQGVGPAGCDHHGRGHVPLATRPGQRPWPRQAALRLRLRLGGLQAGASSVGGATTRCRSCGATGSWPGSTAGSIAPRTRSSSTGSGWRTRRSRAMPALAMRSSSGCDGLRASSTPSGSTPRPSGSASSSGDSRAAGDPVERRPASSPCPTVRGREPRSGRGPGSCSARAGPGSGA